MTALSPIAEVARAVRLGDLEAADAALDALHHYREDVLTGRTAANHATRRDPPLPPLAVDSLAMVAEEQASPRLWRTKPKRQHRKKIQT
jgi:hypothetical protein